MLKNGELGFVILNVKYEDLRDFVDIFKHKTKDELGLDEKGFEYLVRLYLRLAEAKNGAIDGGLDEIELWYPLDIVLPTIDILYRMILHVNKIDKADDIILILVLERVLRAFLAGNIEYK